MDCLTAGRPGPARIADRAAALLPLACATALALLASPAPAPAQAVDFSRARMVDLTHAFNSSTVYWPSVASGFTYAPLSTGRTEGGYWYSAGAFQAPEHGGTHLDAPSHFKEGGASGDQIELSRLILPAVVIDVTAQCASNPDFELSNIEIGAHEVLHGPIPRGSAVLMRTGWSKRWPDRKEYLGDDTPGEVSNLHFPGFGSEAMKILVEQRGVAAVGLDTASLDPGRSTEFLAHRVAAAAGVPGFENLTNLDQLPGEGALLIALPMKIEGGTGGPLRAVAVIPEGIAAGGKPVGATPRREPLILRPPAAPKPSAPKPAAP